MEVKRPSLTRPKNILPKGLYKFLVDPWGWLEKTTHIPSLNVLTILYEFIILLFVVAGVTKIKPNEADKKFVKNFMAAFIGGDNVFINKSNIKHLEKIGIKWGLKLGAYYWLGFKVVNPILHKTHVYQKLINFFIRYIELRKAAEVLLKLMENNIYTLLDLYLLSTIRLTKKDRKMFCATIYAKDDERNTMEINILNPNYIDQIKDKLTQYDSNDINIIVLRISQFINKYKTQLQELNDIRKKITQTKKLKE